MQNISIPENITAAIKFCRDIEEGDSESFLDMFVEEIEKQKNATEIYNAVNILSGFFVDQKLHRQSRDIIKEFVKKVWE